MGMGYTSINNADNYIVTPVRNKFVLQTAGADLSNEFCSHSSSIEFTLSEGTSKVKGQLFVSLIDNQGETTVLIPITDRKTKFGKNQFYQNLISYKENLEHVDMLKILWEQNEHDIKNQYVVIDSIKMFFGDEQYGQTFCRSESKMKAGQRYTFQRC